MGKESKLKELIGIRRNEGISEKIVMEKMDVLATIDFDRYGIINCPDGSKMNKKMCKLSRLRIVMAEPAKRKKNLNAYRITQKGYDAMVLAREYIGDNSKKCDNGDE